MRITIAAGIFYPDVGGPAVHSRKISEALAKAGHQVTVLAYGETAAVNPFFFRVARVSRSWPGPLRWLIYFWKVLAASFRADAIYAFDPSAAGLPAFLAAKILRKRFLIRIGGDPIWERIVESGKRFLPLNEYYEKKLYLQDKPLLFRAICWMLKRADAIVVYSEFFRNFYRDYYGVNPAKITIILNPVSKTEEAGSWVGEPVFLFAGRFVVYKNLPMLIRAFNELWKKFKKGRLKLIGKGPEEQELKSLSSSLPSATAIEILPSMDQAGLFKEIRSAAVCLGPALTEFNPNFILESLSFGKPVILSRGNGLSVRLPEEFLFNPKSEEDLKNKMEQFFDSDFYKAALQKVKELPMDQTWEKVVAAHLALIEAMNPVRGRSPLGGHSPACRQAGVLGRAASNGMKILMISTDAQIFNEGSGVRERLKEYGGLVEELHVVVYTKRGAKNANNMRMMRISDKVCLYPTNTSWKPFYFFDAYRIAARIIKNWKLETRLPVGKVGNSVITTQDPFETGFVGWLIKKRWRLPLQIQIHTDFLSPYFWRESLKNKIRVLLAKQLIKKADGLRVVSERIKNSLVAIGCTLNPIFVLPIFFDAMRLRDAEPNNKYQGDFLILTVARLESEKNLPLAIKAVANFIGRQPDKKIRYVIIGSGREEQKLIKLIKNLGMENYIAIKQVNPADLPRWYKRADLFLLTSNYEGYGLAVAEAMAAGVVPVMSDVGLAGDIVKDGYNGLVFPVGDRHALAEKLKIALSDEVLLNSLRQNLKPIIEKLSSKEAYLIGLVNSWSELL